MMRRLVGIFLVALLLAGCGESPPGESPPAETKLRAAFERCIVRSAENRLSSLKRGNFRYRPAEDYWIRHSVQMGAMSCVGSQERFEDMYDFDTYWAGPDTEGRRAALAEKFDQRFHRIFMNSRNRVREKRARAEDEAEGDGTLDLSHDLQICPESDPTPDPDCE
jgi:hypothetical protein